MEEIEIKECTKCKIPKSIDEFYENKGYKDGYSNWCKQCYTEQTKEWQKNNHEYRLKYQKKYHLVHSEEEKERSKKWHKKNPNHNKEYQKDNREHLTEYAKKRRINPILRLNNNISRAISKSLKNNKNGHHWEDLVGYTQEELKIHLEIQFRDGMNWGNYGRNGWEIDHIIPISLFNIKSTKSKGFKAAWKLENLRPMWISENRKKNNQLFY